MSTSSSSRWRGVSCSRPAIRHGVDSITQIALGAAVGEAALGKKVGGKAAAWGAALGTLPDLDVLAYPFLDPAQELLFHRGPTHALLFSFIVAPLVGALLARLHRKDGAGWKGWSWLAFLALFTHPVLDAFTAYGTQLWLPFSNHPVAWNTISIIDPLYTLPLLIGVAGALMTRRDRRVRRIINAAGLVLSSLYLSITVVNKLHVSSIFERQLEAQNIGHDRLEVMPTLFNNLLWTGLADDGETVYAGLYSHLDEDEHISFQSIPKNDHLLPAEDTKGVLKVLHWFSRGLYTIAAEGDVRYFDDLHVARTDFFITDTGRSIFRFRLILDDEGRLERFVAGETVFGNRDEYLGLLVRRIQGEKHVERGRAARGSTESDADSVQHLGSGGEPEDK